jgi:hypothetical protein
VTVITATYNSRGSLPLALASLLAQDLSDFEAWVVGDACTDDSERAVSELADPRLRWCNLAANSGTQGAPNNEGLRRARGRYIAYLGHDDLWFPWHLSGLLTCIEREQADWVHSIAALVGPEGMHRIQGPPLGTVPPARHAVPPTTWLHRRDAIDRCGWWREHLDPAEGVDGNLLRRGVAAGLRFACQMDVSALKFPSALFGAYARRGAPPQASYLREMADDAHGLRYRLLLAHALAATHAAEAARSPTIGDAVRTVRRAARHAVAGVLGRERWPVAAIRRWQTVKRFHRHQRRRGLLT